MYSNVHTISLAELDLQYGTRCRSRDSAPTLLEASVTALQYGTRTDTPFGY